MRVSIQEIIELRSCVIATLKLKCVALVWVRLRIFSKAAIQKRGSMEPIEPPLDPPLAPSTIVPSLHRLKLSIFKHFTPLAAFSYATWSSATFLASWSESRTCRNFYTLMVSNTWQSVGLGLFIAPSPIVPSLDRLKPSIFKLFKLLASFSYVIWSSATFLASCSRPWTYRNFNTYIR